MCLNSTKKCLLFVISTSGQERKSLFQPHFSNTITTVVNLRVIVKLYINVTYQGQKENQ